MDEWTPLPHVDNIVPLCTCAGTGTDLAIQTMGAGPYGLLVSNVNVGYGSRPWGQMGTVQSASSFMTVWNMASQVKVSCNVTNHLGTGPRRMPAAC